jgi:DNA-binding SARP family transcriptional activator/predicted ATPase
MTSAAEIVGPPPLDGFRMIFVQTLGTALIDLGDGQITPSSSRKFALLLHLSAERGQRVSRAVLRELIFPDQTEKNARHSLRELVYQLRQQGVELEADTDGLLLRADSVRSDYDEVLRNGLPDVERLRAIERGFLPGYAPGHSEAYAEWLEGYRARASFELCKALLVTVAKARVGNDWRMTEQAARACLALDPLNEEATLALAEILAIAGAKAQAIRLLDRYVEEVGSGSRGLTLPAAVLRRRIGERLQETFATRVDFPLVGRQQEMLVLNERLAMAKTGEGQCVVLYGPPGIGKSRLATECCAWATMGGWRVERVGVQPHDRERPMAAFVEAVPGILKLPGALGAAPESLTALTRLTKHELRESTIEVQSAESSDAVSAAIVRAIGDVIDAVTSESPLVLLIDDAQWLDVESLRTLAGLVSPRRARRFLLLITSRERDSVRYFARHAECLGSIEVGELPEQNCATLVRETIGEGKSEADRSFREWLVSAANGNPFFLDSLIRHYQTTGEQFSVSPTINALLDQRLATLTPEAMTVLWTSVALGNHSTIERLIAALEMPHMELVTTIRELELARLIVQAGSLVTPAHWLISDAVTRKASAIADKLGHRRIAAILEAEARVNNDADKLWDCAQHWLAAGEVYSAIQMLEQCAQHSIEIGRLREAAELLVKAASLASHPMRDDLACRAIRLALHAAELDVVLEAAELIDRTSRAGVHDDIEFAELYARGVVLLDESDSQSRLEACIADSTAAQEHRINAGRALLAIIDVQRGSRPAHDTLKTLGRLAELNRESEDPATLKFLMVYHATIGNVANCPDIARRLCGAAKKTRPELAADLYRYAGSGNWRSGSIDDAIEAFDLAINMADSVGLHRLKFALACDVASLQFDLGHDEEASRWMSMAEAVADEIPTLRAGFSYLTISIEMALTRADLDALNRLVDAAARETKSGPVSQVGRAVRAAEISIQHSTANIDVVSAVRELLCHHVPSAERGNISDLETAIAATILADVGKTNAASETTIRYLRDYRRGGAPVARILGNVLKRLQLTEGPSLTSNRETPDAD